MHDVNQPLGDASDHVVEARERARQVLGGEAHIGPVDDWRRALVSGRDAVIVIWLAWIALHGLGDPPYSGAFLVAFAVGFALLQGISIARSVQAQVEYFSSELQRERDEIRTNPQHEMEEVRVLYEAKGFQEPLLSQVVETLTADDDRLLKVMMEEELGLSMHHVNHPLLVGLWNFAGAVIGGLALSIPVALAAPDFAHWWMPVGSAVLLVVVSALSAAAMRRSAAVSSGAALIMAAITGGVVYFLARWTSELPRG